MNKQLESYAIAPPRESVQTTSVSKKSAKVAAMVASLEGRDLDARYLGYFECFNQGLYYEAHDVLEDLWLEDRQGPNYSYFKGLIQLAGAFVHLQKDRLRPAVALFKLARANMVKYPELHEHLDINEVLALIAEWMQPIEASNFTVNCLTTQKAPQLRLRER